MTTVNGESYRFRHFGGKGSSDGYYVRATDNEDETNGLNDSSADVDGRIHLVSRGRAGKAERVIEAIIQRDPALQCVLCGARNFPLLPIDITLVGALSTDSFNSDVAAVLSRYLHGLRAHPEQRRHQHERRAAPRAVNIRGNVTASDNVLSLLNVNVTGAVTQTRHRWSIPPVAPCGPPYPANRDFRAVSTTRRSVRW